MTELECMTEYSLVPVDSNTSANVLDYSWDIQWSSIFINDIQHNSSENINITIPEEINRDYIWDSDNFNLWISGYNVDSEYIQSVIDNQNYIPTREDFLNVFSNFTSFGGLLVVCLFVILVFYMIKKIFN